METKKELKTFEVDYICDECKVGYMRTTGIALPSYPMQFPHKCTNCESKKTFSFTYPMIKYEKINT